MTTHQVMADFKRINEEMNITILINIHHVDLALGYAQRVVGIRAGEIVYALGAPFPLLSPLGASPPGAPFPNASALAVVSVPTSAVI